MKLLLFLYTDWCQIYLRQLDFMTYVKYARESGPMARKENSWRVSFNVRDRLLLTEVYCPTSFRGEILRTRLFIALKVKPLDCVAFSNPEPSMRKRRELWLRRTRTQEEICLRRLWNILALKLGLTFANGVHIKQLVNTLKTESSS